MLPSIPAVRKCCRQPRVFGLAALFLSGCTCYIDGFNIYHAIDNLSRAQAGALNHLKWLDLLKVMAEFTDPAAHRVVGVNYFTAYPTWNLDRESRHKEYVKALEHTGVKVILGQFKQKDAYCKNCKTTYKAKRNLTSILLRT